MKTRYLLLLLAASASNAMADLKDPMTRDEDISKTVVSVIYNQRSDGLWEYTYSLQSPATDLGTVGTFSVDLACDKPFSGYTLPPPSTSGYYSPPRASGGYTPAMVYSSGKQALSFGIGAELDALWAVSLHPGFNRTSLVIVSPAAPGWRTYTLTPYMDTEGWAYTDPLPAGTPWIEEFTVFGSVAGPGCPGVTPPVETPSFDGSAWPNEVAATNKLLTNKAPMVDKWHVASGVDSFQMEIVYAADIDPASFKVTPAWLRPQFDPKPGTRQTVTIPLKPGQNRIGLEVGSTRAPARHKGYHVSETYVDRDVFEIRRDAPANARSGK